jgi:hypothetical protein
MPGLYARDGEDFVANSTTFNDQSRPTVTKLASGNFVVVWDDNSQQGGDPDMSSVRGQMFASSGAPIGGEFLINTATVKNQSDSKVASLSTGGFVVTWTDYSAQGGDDHAPSIKSQMFDATGNRVGGEILVNSTTAGAQQNPHVSGLADGGFVAVWTDVQGLLSLAGPIRGQRFDVAGNKLGDEFQISSLTQRQGSAKVATLDDGRFIVTWTDSTTSATGSLDGNGFGVRGQLFASDGTRIGGEFQVNQNAVGNQTNQSVTALPGGGFLAIWQDQQGFPGSATQEAGGSALEGQIFDAAGNRVGDEFLLNPVRRSGGSGASVAVHADGSFVVSWTDFGYRDNDEIWNHITFQAFDARGNRLGDQYFFESHQSVHDQTALAALDGGRFVAVWHGGTGSAYHNNYPGDVRVQIFAPATGIADIQQTHGQLSETQPDNSFAAILSTSAAAINTKVSYQIVGDTTGGAFRLEGDRIVVADNAKLDHEAAPHVQVTVRAFDGAGGHYDEVLQFYVSDAGIERRWSSTDETRVNTTTSRDQLEPAVAALAGGKYVMVWTDYSGSGDPWAPGIKAQLFNADGSKAPTAAAGAHGGSEFLVHWNTSGGQQFDPHVTGLANGGFLVTWTDLQAFSETGTSIRGFLFDAAGARAGEEFSLQADAASAGDQQATASVGRPGGGFIVVWHDAIGGAGDGNGGGIRGRLFDAASQGGAEFVVNTTAAGEQSEPSIAMLANGGFVVTWTDASGSDPTFATGIRGQMFDAAGAKVGAEFLVNGGTALNPAPGGPEGHHNESSVVGLAGGGFVVVWFHSRDIGLGAVRMQLFDAQGREIGSEFVVQDKASDGRVTALPDGGFMIAYADHNDETSDLPGVGVRAQIFNATGARVGDSFLVNESLPQTQVDPAIATLASGAVAIGWVDRAVATEAGERNAAPLGDGNGTSIKGRTFAPKESSEGDLLPPGSTRGSNGNDIFYLHEGGDAKVYGLGGVDSFYFGGAFTADDYVDGGTNRDAVILQGDYSAAVAFGKAGVSNIVDVDSISLLSGAVTTWGQIGYASWVYDLTMLDGNVAAGATMKINASGLMWDEWFTFDGSAERDGSFQIYAGFGRDQIKGGQQNDVIIFAQDGRYKAGDEVDAGGGYDVVYLRGDYAIDFNADGFAGKFVNVESIGLLSATSNEFAGGGDGEFDYRLVWNDGMLRAGASLTFNGGRLIENENIVFDGTAEMDGNFRLFGGKGEDWLAAGAGNDTLFGGFHADNLAGGSGADTFRYLAVSDSMLGGIDILLDFLPGTDKIDLGRIDAKIGTADVDDAFRFIGPSTFSADGVGGELRAVHVSGNFWQVEGDVNGDGRADLIIQLFVASEQPIANTDFYG